MEVYVCVLSCKPFYTILKNTFEDRFETRSGFTHFQTDRILKFLPQFSLHWLITMLFKTLSKTSLWAYVDILTVAVNIFSTFCTYSNFWPHLQAFWKEKIWELDHFLTRKLNPILGEVWNDVIGWGWSIWPQDSLGCKNHPILPKLVKQQRFDCTSTLATQNYQILPIYTPTLSPQGFTRDELRETIFLGQIGPNF